MGVFVFVVALEGVGNQVGQLQQTRGVGFGEEGNKRQVVDVAKTGALNAVVAVVEPQGCVALLG